MSVVGVSFGVVSSAITAMHSVVIKKALDVVKGSAMHLSWYTNLLSTTILVPLVLVAGEMPEVTKLLFAPTVAGPDAGLGKLRTFLWGTLITVSDNSCTTFKLLTSCATQGVLGFLMSLASLLSIKVTSPITHMVSSAVRGVAGAVLGVWIFGDILSTCVQISSLDSCHSIIKPILVHRGRTSSIAIILGGSIYYTWVKHLESQQAASAPTNAGYDRIPLEDVEAGKGAGVNGKPTPE